MGKLKYIIILVNVIFILSVSAFLYLNNSNQRKDNQDEIILKPSEFRNFLYF